MGGDLDVAAADDNADYAADCEQHDRGNERRAQRSCVRAQIRGRAQCHQYRQAHRQDRQPAANAHGPGQQVTVFDRGDAIGQIGVGRDEYADQRQQEHQQCHARTQRHPRAAGADEPDPRHQHQQGPGELQRVPAAPEQDFVVGLAVQRCRDRGIGPRKCHYGHGCRDGSRIQAEAQGAAPVETDAQHRSKHQTAQHQRGETGAEDEEPGDKDRVAQHRNVIRHDRFTVADERREGHQPHAERTGPQCKPAPAHCMGGAVDAPQHGGNGDEPHQNRQVNVGHQRDVEEIRNGEKILQNRRARQHQQHREYARTDQRKQTQPQPCARQRFPGTVRRWQSVIGRGHIGRAHCSVIPPSSWLKSITSTLPGFRVTISSRW